MALNTNIALGVQPIQQPNMLAQYAQVMGIKAAQQEMRGSEEMRNLFAGGANFDDPEFQRKGYMANAKGFQELLGKRATTQKTEMESLEKELLLRRDALVNVNTPEEYLAWNDATQQGKLGQFLKSAGINPSRERLVAELSKPGGLESIKRNAALGATKIAQEYFATERTRISSGPAYGQLDLARKKDAREQAELDLIRGVLTGGVTPPATAPVAPPMGGGGGGGVAPITPASPVPMGAVSAPAVAPSVVARPNVLADQVAPQAAPAPIVNALNPNAQQPQLVQQISQLIRLGTPKALQAADALVKEYNILNPAGKIEQDANGNLIKVNERTSRAEPVLGPDGKPIKGASPYESAFTGEVGKAQAVRNEKVVTAAQSASANIQKIDSAIELLKTGDTTTGLGAELRTNIDRARALFAGDIKAGKKVADTQILDALLGSDVFSMIQSLGIGARGLDTPAERDYLRQVMTGTIQMDNNALVRLSEIRRNIEVRAIEKYNTQLEKGELNKYFETQGIKPEKIEVPKMVGGSNTVSVGGNTYTFPNAEAAAKFKKDAGIK
jgi:hypothetical protein